MKFKVVTLCGSSRFKKEFEEMKDRLVKKGDIVLSLDTFSKSDDIHISDKEKEILIERHKQKILMSDEILVINKDGYIGNQTEKEIKFARENNKIINYMENPNKSIIDNIKSEIENMSFRYMLPDECVEMYAQVLIDTDEELNLFELNERAQVIAKNEIFYNTIEEADKLKYYNPKNNMCYALNIKGYFTPKGVVNIPVTGKEAISFQFPESYTIKYGKKSITNIVTLDLGI